MITKLLKEVNEKIEILNNLVQDKEYFEKLDERIEKVNNYAQEQKQEIERLNNIIDELEKYLKKQMEYYKLDTDYYVEYKLTLDKLNELREDNK